MVGGVNKTQNLIGAVNKKGGLEKLLKPKIWSEEKKKGQRRKN